MDSRGQAVPKSAGRRWAWMAVLGTFAGLAWRQNRFIHRYAVNMMYWDHWDMYQPFFHRKYWWDLFTFQFGPQLQGVGFLLTRALAGLSGWNSRWEAFGIHYTLAAAALIALLVCRRCGVRPVLALIAVPLLFFNAHEIGDFVAASDLSHGAMPVLLIVLYLAAWLLHDYRARLAAHAFLTFLLVFTGFGWVAALVAPALAGAEAVQAWRAAERPRAACCLAAFAAMLGSWVLFFRYFRIDRMSYPPMQYYRGEPHRYLEFASLMIANFYGLPPRVLPSIVFGTAVLALLAFLVVWHALKIRRAGLARAPGHAAVFFLSAYALLYCALTAAGRLQLGLDQAPAASRYVTLLIPAALAPLLHLGTVRRRGAGALAVLYALCLVPATVHRSARERATIAWYHDGRSAWRTAYLATHSEAEADRMSHFQVYPGSVAGRLDFLERHRLNLFHGVPPAGTPAPSAVPGRPASASR
ncbi:MAG: hypothetical protein ACREFX_11585 [Opitutaceae bacterium]